MTGTLEIVIWDSDRLAITGSLPNSRALFERLKTIARIRAEYWSGDAFTFSLASRHRLGVLRILENLTIGS